MRNTSVKTFAATLALTLALLAVAPAAVEPAAAAPATTIAAPFAARDLLRDPFSRVMRTLRRLLGMGTTEVMSPPNPAPAPAP